MPTTRFAPAIPYLAMVLPGRLSHALGGAPEARSGRRAVVVSNNRLTMVRARGWLLLLAVALLLACGGPSWEPPLLSGYPKQVGWASPMASAAPAAGETTCSVGQAAPQAPSAAGKRLALGLGDEQLELPAGRWVVMVAVPARSYVSLGLAGPRKALERFEVIGPRKMRRLRADVAKDDGKLPAFVSFEVAAKDTEITAIVDVSEPVRLLRAVADAAAIEEPSPRALKLGEAQPRALVGLPFPIERQAGYSMYGPQRYRFVRADVAAALREAFRQTRIRFKRNSIGIADATQWNSQRPAADLGRVRHISHDAGRDIDIGLPSSDGSASVVRRRCEGVLVDNDVLKCAPGTVRHFDALRLAYLLGLLIDGPTPSGRHIPNVERRPGPTAVVQSILTDQAYIDEIRKALLVLRRKRWIHDEAFGALGEEGLLRPSPWHVDHVHIRFGGEKARAAEVLRFEAAPPPKKASNKAVPPRKY